MQTIELPPAQHYAICHAGDSNNVDNHQATRGKTWFTQTITPIIAALFLF